MGISYPLWVGTQHSRHNRSVTKIRILSLGLFIDLCKINGLDHKRIILDSLKEDYDRKE